MYNMYLERETVSSFTPPLMGRWVKQVASEGLILRLEVLQRSVAADMALRVKRVSIEGKIPRGKRLPWYGMLG